MSVHDAAKEMEELYRQGRYLDWCFYYKKPLKILTNQEIDHCRSCGDLCRFLGRECKYLGTVIEGYEFDEWDEAWDYLWDELDELNT